VMREKCRRLRSWRVSSPSGPCSAAGSATRILPLPRAAGSNYGINVSRKVVGIQRMTRVAACAEELAIL
jgi:hypothetical protein